MAHVNPGTATGLHWVRAELGASIERVRAFVDDFLMAPAKPLPLQRSLVELHQIRGTLCMVQCEDAALLAEEMRNAVHDLLSDTTNAPEQAFEVLLGATAQLADYLDLIAAGERGTGLVFLPLVNELRVARGAAVLNDSELFIRYCRLLEPDGGATEVIADAQAQAGQVTAGKATPAFQAALLNVLRNRDVAGNLARLAGIVADMESALSAGRAQRLFSAAGALLEALQALTGEPDQEAKRLLGQVGQQLKAVAEHGGAALAEVPDTLLFGLVFAAGRSPSRGDRVRALRAEYDLATRLPDADELDRLRRRLRRPNTGLVSRLSDEIRADLAAARDGIDQVLRKGEQAPASMDEIVARLERIANTLGMLGLTALQRVLRNQIRAIQDLAGSGVRDSDAWMALALALLRVEQGLDRSLFAHVVEGAEVDPEPAAGPERDLAASTAAVYREALANLARIQTLVTEFLGSGDEALLHEGGRRFREIEGGLQLLGHDDDVRLVGVARGFVTGPRMLQATGQSSLARPFADTVAAIEFYLEARYTGRPELAALQAHVQASVRALAQPALGDTDAVAAPDAPAEPPSEPPAIVDPDLRATFLDEAAEVLATLRREVPAWSADVDSLVHLTAIRRAFQTLEGSARMVRAADISAFAGAIENLLNRCLQGARGLDADVVAVVTRALDATPGLIEAFRAERASPTLARLLADANQAAGAPEQRAESGHGSPHDTDDATAGAGLAAVFTDEAVDLVAAIDQQLSAWRDAPDDPRYPRALHRLCHTLKGSAATAGAAVVGRMAQALEQTIREHAAHGPDAASLGAMREALNGLRGMLDRFRLGESADDLEPLLARLDGVSAAASEPVSPRESGDASRPPAAGESADTELLQIFVDEAGTLLDAIDDASQRWRAAPWADTARHELARNLHTLKGSARVADLGAVGDVSHAMETVVAQAADADGAAREALLDGLAQAVAGLYAMLDQLRAGRVDLDSEPLLARLGEDHGAIDAGAIHAAAAGPSANRSASPPGGSADADAPRGGPEPEPDQAFASQLDWQPQPEQARVLPESARMAVPELERMLNEAGEISIGQSRIADHNAELATQLGELAVIARRMNDQLRRLDAEVQNPADDHPEAGEPVPMDRLSTLQELSHGLAESVTDLMSLHGLMSAINEQGENLVMQQGRVTAGLRRHLTGTMMVPFSDQQPRLQRVVHQAANEHGRDADITVTGGESELDRIVLERLGGPLDHLLRNAIVHGIESPGEREAAGKARRAAIDLRVCGEGTRLVIELSDDGRGLDLAAIRATARERGWLDADADLSDSDALRLILQPGFSTAEAITQTAGRGVGLDVVHNEIQQLGGSLAVSSEPGRGTCFTIRVPLSLAVSQVLMVDVGGERYAVPVATIDGVARVPRAELTRLADNQAASIDYGGAPYQVRELGALLGLSTGAEDSGTSHRALLVRAGEARVALIVDAMSGSRDIVVKPVGPQVAAVPGFSAATIQADGTVVLILDVAALVQAWGLRALAADQPASVAPADRRPTALVVDDSITIRRTSERFLASHGFRVVTARDGVEAVDILQSVTPAVVLLDIEMPRMDGFELAAYMRNSGGLAQTPIVMISSRSGASHQERARAIGVDRFVTKPYREQDLLAQIRAVLCRPDVNYRATGAEGDGVQPA